MTDSLSLDDFLAYIQRGDIPPAPPMYASPCGRNTYLDALTDYFAARDACCQRGMYAIVDAVWTKALADWIDLRRVLEVMAGAGWLAKALHQHGVDIVATDDLSWHHPTRSQTRLFIDLEPVFPVQTMDARDAVQHYADRDILLLSWPPMDDVAAEVCALWGSKKPIVYIGEDEGGCTASDAFFAHFRRDPSLSFPLLAWPMVHDRVWVGYWTEGSS